MPFIKKMFQKQSPVNEEEPKSNDLSSSNVSETVVNEEEPSKNKPKPPRIVVEAPTISQSDDQAEGDQVLIKAQTVPHGNECRFLLNQNLLDGYSWFFSNRNLADNSLLGQAIFSVDETIETILIHNSTFTITCRVTPPWDWEPIAKKVGSAVRSHLQSGDRSFEEGFIEKIPSEDVIREKVQEVIDMEINPGVAAHGGVISIENVEGNTITINMGGGCQGCSSAAITLKGGVETRFRETVPELGAILDVTDHASGENPYFS